MSPFDLEPRLCDRRRAHRGHDWVESPRSRILHQCPGHDGSARSLADLLDRRPELVDLTAVTMTIRLAVSAA